MQNETAPQMPNINVTTKTTSTHENITTLQEQAKPKATPHTKITLQRNPPPTEIIANPTRHQSDYRKCQQTQSNVIKNSAKFGHTMDVDLVPNFDKRPKN